MTADQLQLITAAVDGELSATEAGAFRQLMAISPEARTLHAQLQADSNRLRTLTRIAPPVDLQAKVLARVANVKPQYLAEPATLRESYRRMPTWMPVATAASIVFCIISCSFAYYVTQTRHNNETANNQWAAALPAQPSIPIAVTSPTAPLVELPNPATVVRIDVLPVPSVATPRDVLPVTIAAAPEPRSVSPDFLSAPLRAKLPPFHREVVRVPFLRTVAELERDDIRQLLTDELGHNSAVKFDLFVRDTASGAEVFQNAAKAAGLTLFADATTLAKVKKKQVHAVVIYIENLTPAEHTALFAMLATVDEKSSPRVCDSLHLTPIVRSDETELKAILGIDVGLFKRPNGTTGAGQGSDKSKPVSAGTIDSVVKSVSTAPAKPVDKPAMLMTWQPGPARTIPALSVELKQFLAKRGDRKPNAVPAIIVIRPVG